tara:strand:+ start:105 stop:719 length:615 start_codon:yes stop_codon:yes gene_type:complete
MKIICIGRNYTKHAKELGNAVPTEPVYFMKPDSALLPKKQPFFYPNFTKDLHYEVELVIKICKLGKNISKKFASTYYNEIGLGIDFTARDIQLECKTKGLPWERAKAFDYSAPLSRQFIQKSEFKNIDDISFSLEKNGKIVQKGNSQDMLFDFDHLICYLSQFMTLKIGDLIFTGTPAGVGPVKIGDQLIGYIEDKKMLDLNIK